jgi:protein-tyrosine phosphatase
MPTAAEVTPGRSGRRAGSARFSAVCLLLAAIGCVTTPPPLIPAHDPIVERVAGDDLLLRWDAAPGGAPVRVFAGTSPDSIARSAPIAEMNGRVLRIRGLDPESRWFFELRPRHGERRVVSERLLPLAGAHNFRDLGGYRTGDGQAVRWGLLYRSDDLEGLTNSDLRFLKKLGIRLVCDFRSEYERARKPDRLPVEDPPEVELLAIEDENFDPRAVEAMIRARSVDDVDFDSLLVDSNRSFATASTDQYARMFERIVERENLPALVHCTAGKDRTGFASAIILLALGVPRETVFEDYLLTNVYTANEIEKTLMKIRIYLLSSAGAERIRPLLGVRRDYLQAGLDAIDEHYGSVEAYLRDGLGVSDVELERFRAMMLEPTTAQVAGGGATPARAE